MFNTIVIGVLTSFIASIVFTFLFTQFKPKLYISDKIAFSNDKFRIKVINKGKAPVINIRAELCYLNLFNVPNGIETNTIKIILTKSEIFVLDGHNRDSKFATYTYRFVTGENIQKGLDEGKRQSIRFKITATHSISNISKVFERNYDMQDIIKGDFVFGDSIDITQ